MQVKYIEEAKNKLEKQAKPLTQKVDKTNQLISELKNKIEKMENHSQNMILMNHSKPYLN
ncbi:hypothetical protein QK908_00670 [Lactococcus cremoris]